MKLASEIFAYGEFLDGVWRYVPGFQPLILPPPRTWAFGPGWYVVGPSALGDG